jgi:hypothetical protein
MTLLKDGESKKDEEPAMDMKSFYELPPHKTNVLPKEFEKQWKVALAKWEEYEANPKL